MVFNLDWIKDLNEAAQLYQEAYEDATAFAEKWQITIQDIEELVLPELKERILSQRDNMADSVERNVWRINELDMHIAGIDAEIKRLQTLKKTWEWESERRKSWIKFCMESTWVEKLETQFNKIWFRTSEQVVVADWAELPDEYCRIKKEPDKTKIKEAIKWWTQIDGCGIVQNHNLIIK